MKSIQEYISEIENYLEREDASLKDAVALCDEAIKNYPNEGEFYYLKAVCFYNFLEPNILPRKEFSALLKQATDLNPKDIRPYLLWAQANECLGYPELAATGYKLALEVEPEKWELYLEYARLLDGTSENYEERIGACTKVIENCTGEILNPAYGYRAGVYLKLKQYQNVIDDCTKAIEIKPDYGGGYINRGMAKQKLGDFKGALVDYSKAIELFPKYPLTYAHRGEVQFELGDIKAALTDVQTAYKLDSKNNEIIDILCQVQNTVYHKITESLEDDKPASYLVLTLKTGQKVRQIISKGEIFTFFILGEDVIDTVSSIQKNFEPSGPGACTVEKEERKVFQDKQRDTLGDDLVSACKEGDLEKIKTLIEKGADINYENVFGETPLFKAIQYRRPITEIETLLKYGANVNFENKYEETPISLASKKYPNNQEIINLLERYKK